MAEHNFDNSEYNHRPRKQDRKKPNPEDREVRKEEIVDLLALIFRKKKRADSNGETAEER